MIKNITTVGEDLVISCDDTLTNLSGLENLVSVGGDVHIYGKNLISYSGLDNLNSIGGVLFITGSALEDIQALEALSSIAGRWIFETALTNLSGLGALTSINGGMTICHNPNLKNLSGLDKLNSIYSEPSLNFFGHGLLIYENPVLTSLSGLESLTLVEGEIRIHSNDMLPNLTGLENLTTVSGVGGLWISGKGITSLKGLTNLTSVTILYIYRNPVLTSLTGMKQLTSINGYLKKSENSSLTDLGLDNLCSVETNFIIDGNSHLFQNVVEDLIAQVEGCPDGGIGGEAEITDNNDCSSSDTDL